MPPICIHCGSWLRYRDLFISYFLSANTYFRTGIAAGSPIPIDLMRNLIDKMNLRDLTNAYGMSAFLFSATYSFLVFT